MWLWSADALFWQLSIDHNMDVYHQVNTGLGLPHQLESLIFQIGFLVVQTEGRTYGHVITKISRMDQEPIT